MKLTLSVFALFFLSLKAYSDTGKWEYSAEMDPLTGKDNIIVFLRPESIFSYTENTVLAVSCQREKTMLGISWTGQAPFGFAREYSISTSVGDEKTITTMWLIEGQLSMHPQPIQTLKRLAKESKWLVEGPSPVGVIEFDITGLEEAIKPIREACDW
jgi:type VI secretion system VasI family protein